MEGLEADDALTRDVPIAEDQPAQHEAIELDAGPADPGEADPAEQSETGTGTIEPEHVTAVLPLQQSTAGGSGSFLVRADDGERYWCKAPNNDQGPRVPLNEQIVGRLAELIGVEVCRPKLVKIPPELAGWEYRPGKHLVEGWAHGSLAVADAMETHQLEHRGDGDNARRHAGFFAIFDWLHGDDPQWLYSTSSDNAYYQHDCGHYFPSAPNWTPELLLAAVGQPKPLGQDAAGLDRAELDRLATALDTLTREDIEAPLANLHTVWGVARAEIEAMIDFADARRAEVAARLRAL